MERGKKTSERGFTILEAAISMTVLAVALLSLWGTLVYCSRSDVASEQKNKAVRAAQAKIEELKSEEFGTLISKFGPGGDVGHEFNVPTFGEDGAGTGQIAFFVDETTSTMGGPLDLNGDGDTDDTDVSASYDLLPVMVTITWDGPLGEQRINLRSILRKED
jgi:type II secretory pathway pseudopilin PulG